MTTILPQDDIGDPDFDIENKLDTLQSIMVMDGIDIGDLDRRTSDGKAPVSKEEQAMLIDTAVDPDENDVVSSKQVDQFNRKYDVNLETNPEFIFASDLDNMNFVNTIRESNESYAKERDLFTVRPPVDTQQRIADSLRNTEAMTIRQKLDMGMALSEEEQRILLDSLQP